MYPLRQLGFRWGTDGAPERTSWFIHVYTTCLPELRDTGNVTSVMWRLHQPCVTIFRTEIPFCTQENLLGRGDTDMVEPRTKNTEICCVSSIRIDGSSDLSRSTLPWWWLQHSVPKTNTHQTTDVINFKDHNKIPFRPPHPFSFVGVKN